MSKFTPNVPSASRHHADWLSLVEYSGPFVSLPVMLRVFPPGLEPRDPAQAKVLRAAYEEWQDDPTAPGKQRAWVLHVLTAVLGYPSNQITEGQILPAGLEASMPEMGEILRPDFALIGPTCSDTAGQAQLLIASYPAEQKLDRPVIGKHWKATPATRMMELLHGANVPLGLVTNGEQWMLVYAPRGEITGYASWYGALWLDEPITLRAFHSLLGVRRFFGVAADSTLLALLKESASDQQEVTDQLGYQVREAVEVLVQSFDAIDKESNRSRLNGVSPTAQYEAALTTMMRLVFLFSAEERGLLHLGKPLYDNNYAVSTLQEQLQEVADRYGEEVLERRTDAWARLLASFRAVHGGIKHQDLLMQAYGGSLFDPDRYPFLEGRAAGSGWRSTPAEPLAVNNRVVLHLLNSLQRLRIKVGAGGTAETRRISFRALGVEQIGHVYEGLLDHTGVRATETVLGVKGTRNKEPEIPLAKLESLLALGQDKVIDFLKEETGKSLSALRNILNEGSLLDEHKLLVASGHDEALLARLRPFSSLIREDSFERPLVVLDGSVYVTAGTTRRSTGTHYTPPSLTEPIVQHTLEPLVYEGPAEGVPRDQWKLKSPRAILDLKVCDMAMGSGAFLVQACRYLAERLTEAWENEEKQHPGQVLITPDGKFSEGAPSERLVPADANERIAIARRVVADRCLYGVDINPMAVEMAKLSLWLITVDANRPFTFLDHAFKCGDSLLGITSLEQLENFSLLPDCGKQQAFGTLNLWRHIDEAKKKREALEEMPSDTPEQIAAKTALYAESEEAVAKLNAAADVLMAVELKGLKGRAYEAEREVSADHMMACWAAGLNELKKYARQKVGTQHCLHWALAFPEIIERRGFDAFVGNPPFIKGHYISRYFGDEHRQLLAAILAKDNAGLADFSTYFLSRGCSLVSEHGHVGLIVTNSLRDGDSREVGLKQQVENGLKIRLVEPDLPWPGTASVIVCFVILARQWNAKCKLAGRSVEAINPTLTDTTELNPYSLSESASLSFIGSYLLGDGFVFQEGEAKSADFPKYSEVVLPYIGGQELFSSGEIAPRRHAICFWDWPLTKVESEYPVLYKRIFEKVKPSRDKVNRDRTKRLWWIHAENRPGLYHAIGMGGHFSKHPKDWQPASGLSRVIVKAKSSDTWAFAFLPSKMIFDQSLVIFASDQDSFFSVLQSDIHLTWADALLSGNKGVEARKQGGAPLSYTPSTCFETFPLPPLDKGLSLVGHSYYSFRQKVMTENKEGLTKIYNRFHDANASSHNLVELRRLHFEMNLAVVAAYGWQDIDLGQGFQDTKQGIRYTISDAARREVLDRLLALNHQRHSEEVAEKATLPVSASTKRGRKSKGTDNQILMDL